jgi:hypothetical protein
MQLPYMARYRTKLTVTVTRGRVRVLKASYNHIKNRHQALRRQIRTEMESKGRAKERKQAEQYQQ